MVEVELKFQIPEARRNAILKAIDPKKSEIIHLQAKYYDTEDRQLAQHGVALRQRLEGTRWIQTLKAAGKSHLHRFEDNIDLGELEQAPTLDMTHYQNNSDISLNPTQPPFKKGRSSLFSIHHQFSAHTHRIETCIDIHNFTCNAICPR